MSDAKQFKKLEKQMKSLANYRRLLIIAFIKKQNKVSVGDIAEELKISIQSTSRHLKILENAEILSSEQKGLLVYYFLLKSESVFISQFISAL